MTLIENILSKCGIEPNNICLSDFPTYKTMIYSIFSKLCKDKKSSEMLENILFPLIKSIALRFLKERNIVLTFIENYHNGKEFREKYSKTSQKIFIIETAFVWGKTKEGYSAWFKINKDFDYKLHFIMNHDFNI